MIKIKLEGSKAEKFRQAINIHRMVRGWIEKYSMFTIQPSTATIPKKGNKDHLLCAFDGIEVRTEVPNDLVNEPPYVWAANALLDNKDHAEGLLKKLLANAQKNFLLTLFNDNAYIVEDVSLGEIERGHKFIYVGHNNLVAYKTGTFIKTNKYNFYVPLDFHKLHKCKKLW